MPKGGVRELQVKIALSRQIPSLNPVHPSVNEFPVVFDALLGRELFSDVFYSMFDRSGRSGHSADYYLSFCNGLVDPNFGYGPDAYELLAEWKG